MDLQIGYDNPTSWYIDFTGKTGLNKTQLRKTFSQFGKIKGGGFQYL